MNKTLVLAGAEGLDKIDNPLVDLIRETVGVFGKDFVKN